ncbi:PAS domain S-box protein [Mobilitalea sibirica]|uniref:histidine kinase n=1 Tax=Mobilitalea sibirica TaxID=1462919 RepID=A0A8J7KUY8_9FIRM|nr:PAS domain S-box protein [Mobilitalea sibirica]MBH1939535.1 PAS domain S-box protein [Mobilitalea sibirica]
MQISKIHTKDLAIICNNLLDQMPGMIWKLDENFNIIYMNKAGLSFVREDMDSMLDKGWFDFVLPDDRQVFCKGHINHHTKKEKMHYEFRLRRYDGCYRWCRLVVSPCYDFDGNFSCYIGIISDITEQKETEEILERYKLFSKNARDIILFVDLDGRIIEANKAAVIAYGYTYEELCSLNIYDLREVKR